MLHELKLLKADMIVITSNMKLRRDGMFDESRKEPDDRGVAVYFELDGQKKVLAGDKWMTVGENLWAIAKTLEVTRGIERWGIVTQEQAFAGYTALAEKTQRSCWEVLGIDPDAIRALRDPETMILYQFKAKAKGAHPDQGGNAELFAEVVTAKDMALQLIKQ